MHERLGHYDIQGKLGQGGMGEVYRARDTKLGRDVALKVLPAEVAGDPERLARLQREARTAAALNHPNLVHLYSVDEAEGVHFITMELVEGRGLDQVLAAGALPAERLLPVATAIAQGVAAAHARGIVHRDLKPANVMLTDDGTVKVLDFGLATEAAAPAGQADGHELATQALLTQEGAVMGTAPYMSPEQIRGQRADARSDVFSLGVLLYELATGRRPFHAETPPDLASAILRDQPAPLETVVTGLPPQLGQVVLRALEKDPAARYADAGALAADLRGLAAPSSGTGPRIAKSRRPLVTVGVLAVALGMMLFILQPWSAAPPAEADAATVAVLPFENQDDPDGTNAFFTNGVHEDVMVKLGNLQNVRVISRTSVLAMADHEGTLPEIGKLLGARYVLEGTVRRAGNQVRVTATLVDAQTDQSLWSNSFDHELENVFAVQSEIAQAVAGAMQATISPGERAALDTAPTVVVDAYDAYLRARQILNQSYVPFEQVEQAVARLEEAVSIDPNFTEGWALLVIARSDEIDWLRSFDGRETDAQAAVARTEEALDHLSTLAPESVPTLRAEAVHEQVVQDDPVAAMQLYGRVLEEKPDDSATLLRLPLIQFQLGQLDRAIESMERAYALDPANGRLAFFLTFGYEFAGRFAEMVPIYEKLLALEPERTHYQVQAKYYAFLSTGSLDDYRKFEEAVRTIEFTEQCNLRTVQDREMVVAMFNDEFDRYDKAFAGKWDQHHQNHGNWSCPGILNSETNHARLLQAHGQGERAAEIIRTARESSTRPYDEQSLCLFNTATFEPKLDYLEGDSTAARREFEAIRPEVMANDKFPRGPVERSVLLETADLVAPDQVYGLYREITSRPNSFISMEEVCANPWKYPNLVRDPRFQAEVRKDGRFVEFLQHFGVMEGV